MSPERARGRCARRVAAAALGALALAGCGGNTSGGDTDAGGAVGCTVGADKRIGIATGNATGVYFALGNAFAEVLPDATDGKVRATAAETGGSVENIEQLVADKYQVAFALADSAADAVAGEASFDGKKQPVRALARIHTSYTQLVARADAHIGSVADLRGKRVATGPPRSGTEVIAQRILRAAGLDPDSDVKAQRLDLAKTVDGMKDGTVDAMFFSGGLPTPGIADLFTTEKDGVRLVDVSPLLGKMRDVSQAYLGGSIPAGTYGIAADVPTIVVPNLLLVREDADADLACVLTKALFSHRDDLVRSNASAADIRIETARDTGPVPLHRGAVKALDDLGAPPAGTPFTPAPVGSAAASAAPSGSPSDEPSESPSASPSASATPSASASPTRTPG